MERSTTFNCYGTFADFITSDTELGFSRRRFDRLNARNLRYTQSELVGFEARLVAFDVDDYRSPTRDVQL